MQLVIGIDHDRAEAFGAEEQSVHRDLHAFAADLHGEMDLRITAGQQFACMIRNVDFRAQGTGSEIDGFRRAHNFAFEFAAGILRKFEISRQAGMNGRSVSLRHVDVDTNWIRLRKEEELLSSAAIAGVDQLAEINLTPRNDTAEGCSY